MEKEDVIFSDENNNRIRTIPDPATQPPRVPGGVVTNQSYGTAKARESGAEETIHGHQEIQLQDETSSFGEKIENHGRETQTGVEKNAGPQQTHTRAEGRSGESNR